jgi:pimeloyl-ACP methyl ester carboxylesterase
MALASPAAGRYPPDMRALCAALAALGAVLGLTGCPLWPRAVPSQAPAAEPLGPPLPPGLRYLDGPQGRLAVSDGGQGGLPVVLVHGGVASHAQWRAQLRHLRRSRRAIALDLRGFGASEPPRDGDYTPEAMAEDVAAVADELGLERFVLVGHAAGGHVVAAYAAAHPERLAGLVLADVGGRYLPSGEELEQLRVGFRPGNYERFLGEWFGPTVAASPEAVKRAVWADIRATPRERQMQILYGSMGFDPGAALARYPGPRLAIAAETTDGPLMLHRTVPGIPAQLVKGAGHWLMMDRPEEFNRILEGFLAELK